MKLLVVLSWLALVRGDADPPVYLVNGVPHTREILFNNTSRHFNFFWSNLPVDYTTNNLYIAVNNDLPAVFNINTKVIKPINGIPAPRWITFDQATHTAYIATATGIYKYSQDTNKTELVGANGDDIFRVYFKDILYYRKYLESNIFTLVNGQSAQIEGLNEVYEFLVDDEDNIIYTNSDTLHKYNKVTKSQIVYEKKLSFNMLTTDKNGKVYFSSDDGVYEVKKDSDAIEKIVTIDHPREIAFDNENNLIYYNMLDLKLYILKPIVETTTNIASSTIANNYSDKQSDDQKPVVSDNNTDIKKELRSINDKIEDLPQIINILLSNAIKKELTLDANSARTIHFDNVVLQNVNISLGTNGAGTGQVVERPAT